MNLLDASRMGAVIALALFAGCSSPAPANVAHAEVAPAPLQVKLAKPKREGITRTITLTANVEAYEQVSLYAKVAGYLKTINVDIGDRVGSGELLAALEVPEINQQYRAAQSEVAERQADLDKARADADLAKVIFVRSEGLRAKEAITEQDMDEAGARHSTADAQVEVAQSRLRAAQAHLAEVSALLSYSRITSPFYGIVTRRFVDPGALLQAATANNSVTPIVTVARIDIIRVFVDVPEPDAPLISQGEAAVLRVGSVPQRTFKGNVTRYAGALDPATRTMRTEVDLCNSDAMLRPGMFGDLTLRIIDHPDVLTLPNDVVRHDNEGAFVYVLDGTRALRRTVETGLTSDDRVEIVSGIDDRARVIAGSSPELKGGASVRAVVDTATPRSAGEREDSAR
jgi:RND family efflux transporter MFP subunit